MRIAMASMIVGVCGSAAAAPCPKSVPGQADQLIDECVAGKFGGPGWIVVHTAANRQVGDSSKTISVIAGGKVIASTTTSSWGPLKPQAVDLDGDGRDEVLWSTNASGFNGVGFSIKNLNVAAIVKTDLAVLETIVVEHEHDGEFGPGGQEPKAYCEGKLTFTADPKGGKRMVLDVTAGGEVALAKCPAAGRHTYRRAGAKLVEI
jgi:hypothetical protein